MVVRFSVRVYPQTCHEGWKLDGFSVMDVVVPYLCLLFSLCVHEASHALMADWRGDSTPRFMGRVTLNPMSHIDPLGTVVMPLLMLFMGPGFLFGWAKPVPFNPLNLKDIRRDPVLIALAGPGSNLMLAVVSLIALRLLIMFGSPAEILFSATMVDVLFQLILINLVLMVFNLIPVPPLDGHYLLHYFLPPAGQRMLEGIGPFGIIIAIIIANTFMAAPISALLGVVKAVALWQW